ncbi:hypothetical protein LguiA_008362 [Lonicera macranthoides]
MSGSNLSDDSFPENFGNLPSLSDLDLSKNQFRRLPNCIRNFSGLKSLSMYECHRLQSLDLNGLMMKAGYINVTSCKSLENVMSLNETVDLWLNGCYKLVGQEDTWKDYFKKDDTWKEGTFEHGKFNICLKAKKEPMFPGYENLQSGYSYALSLLFTPPRTQCLNVWCSMSDKAKFNRSIFERYDLNFIRAPNHFPHKENVGLLSRWRIGNQLEAGHESSVTFDIKDEYEVKEGFKIVYRDIEEANGSASTMKESHHSFPAMLFVSRVFDKYPDEELWFPKRLTIRKEVNYNKKPKKVEEVY